MALQPNRMFSKSDLRRLILPLILEQLLIVTVGIADTVMVTSVGEAAVSGISLVDNINNLLIQVFAALATGGAVVASQYMGRGEADNACKTAKQLVYITLILSVGIGALCVVFNRGLLTLLFGRAEQAVMDNAFTYFWLSALSYPFIALYNSGAAVFRSMRNSRVPLIISAVMNVINISGNALLIYVFDMGVAGAAIASLASRFTAAVIIAVLLHQKKRPIHIKNLLKFEWSGKMLGRIMRIGIPAGIENGMFQFGRLAVGTLVSSFSTAAIAANAITNVVCSLALVPGGGMGLALITVVGQCAGAGEYDQIKYYVRWFLIRTYIMMASLCAALFFAAGPLVSLFELSPAAAADAVMLLRWFACAAALFWPLSFLRPHALRACGDVKFTMAVAVASMWIVRVGASYLLCLLTPIGILGVWLSMYFDWIVRGVAFTVRYWRGKWKRMHVI